MNIESLTNGGDDGHLQAFAMFARPLFLFRAAEADPENVRLSCINNRLFGQSRDDLFGKPKQRPTAYDTPQLVTISAIAMLFMPTSPLCSQKEQTPFSDPSWQE